MGASHDDRTATVAALLEQSLQSHRDRPAVVDGERTLSYGELDDRSRRLAGVLARVAPGRRPVAMYAANAAAWAEFDVACARAGFARLGFNSRLNAAEVGQALQRFDVAALVTTSTALTRLDRGALVGRPVLVLDGDRRDDAPTADSCLDYERALAEAGSAGLPATVEPGQPYLIGLTSGTTGVPKGATHDQVGRAQALLNLQAVCGIDQHSRSLHVLSMSNASLPIMAVFLAGGCNVISDDAAAATIARLVDDQRITHLTVVPLVAQRLVDFAREHAATFRSLRSVIAFGAPASPRLLRECFALFGSAFVFAYGSTEAPMPVTALRVGEPPDPASGDPRTLQSVGRAQGGWELRVRRQAGDLGDGPGELAVRGPGLMAGYWDDAEATAAAFDEDGFYATGDLAQIDPDGTVTITGRLRDFLVSGGYNVFPAEVEARLQAHPGVAEAVVVGVWDETWGEAVAAAVVPSSSDIDVTPRELAEWVQEALASYKKPRRIILVDDLPRSPFGKVRRGVLRQQFEAEPTLGILE